MEITIEEAIRVIETYPNADSFVCENCQGRLIDGEYDDNSFELADYYNECQSIVSQYLFDKHG
jgi:hypothetical protein